MKKGIIIFLILSFNIFSKEILPPKIEWQTNLKDPVWSSPKAKKGGTLRTFIAGFPPTFRVVGPDSNSGFRQYILENHLSLTTFHPNTGHIIPSLATHWAYSHDYKTIYFKLDPEAKWSDGEPVTADDYIFTLEFMTSKFIVAPWYNDHYKKYFEKIIKYDDHTIGIKVKIARPPKEMHLYYAISPTPEHFYKNHLNKDFIKKFNWKIVPNTGPYQVSSFRKGKYIIFERKKDWWARNKRYNKNRYNIDALRLKVIRDINIAFHYFKKYRLDYFPINLPQYWHKRATGDLFDSGYIKKLWFYVDKPQPTYGLWPNIKNNILSDIRVRKALSHSINVRKVIKSVLRNDYLRLQTVQTGYGEYTNYKIKARPFDLQKADDLLNEAGWNQKDSKGYRVKDNKRLSLTINYGVKNHTDRLVIIKEEAQKAGIELKLKLLDGSAFFKSILEKQHEIVDMAWSSSLLPQYWGQFHSDNAHKSQTNNITNVNDSELDKMIDDYRKEFNENKRAELSRQIQQKIHSLAIYIPTWLIPYFRTAYWRWWKFPKIPATKFSDELFEPFSIAGGLFWFNPQEKENTLEAMSDDISLPSKIIIDETFKAQK